MRTPLKTIRKKCFNCSGFSQDEVRNCEHADCSLFIFRMGKKPSKIAPSRLKAIRKFCLWCCLDSAHEVKLCPATDCDLYPYRFGHNPTKAGQGKGRGFGSKSLKHPHTVGVSDKKGHCSKVSGQNLATEPERRGKDE